MLPEQKRHVTTVLSIKAIFFAKGRFDMDNFYLKISSVIEEKIKDVTIIVQ